MKLLGQALGKMLSGLLVMGLLLLGPAGVWLFPRRASLQWRPVIIVASGCSALMLLGLILALLQTP